MADNWYLICSSSNFSHVTALAGDFPVKVTDSYSICVYVCSISLCPYILSRRGLKSHHQCEIAEAPIRKHLLALRRDRSHCVESTTTGCLLCWTNKRQLNGHHWSLWLLHTIMIVSKCYVLCYVVILHPLWFSVHLAWTKLAEGTHLFPGLLFFVAALVILQALIHRCRAELSMGPLESSWQMQLFPQWASWFRGPAGLTSHSRRM